MSSPTTLINLATPFAASSAGSSFAAIAKSEIALVNNSKSLVLFSVEPLDPTPN